MPDGKSHRKQASSSRLIASIFRFLSAIIAIFFRLYVFQAFKFDFYRL